MKKLLVCLLGAGVTFCILGAQIETAPALNPETFESYTTGNWLPQAGKNGWEMGKVGNPAVNEDLTSADIKDSGIDGKYLRVVGGGWNGIMRWNASLNKENVPKQLLEITFRLSSITPPAPRFSISMLTGTGLEYWVNTASFEISDNAGNKKVALRTAEETELPGSTSWSTDSWWTLQFEFDYPNETVRARFGPTGGKFNDWTKTLFMKETGQSRCVYLGYNGTVDIDNLKILPATSR